MKKIIGLFCIICLVFLLIGCYTYSRNIRIANEAQRVSDFFEGYYEGANNVFEMRQLNITNLDEARVKAMELTIKSKETFLNKIKKAK